MTQNSKSRKLIDYIYNQLSSGNCKFVNIYGKGRCMTKVISVTEVVKELLPGLHQVTELMSEMLPLMEQASDSEDDESENGRIERYKSVIRIILAPSPEDLDTNAPGYQEPKEIGKEEERGAAKSKKGSSKSTKSIHDIHV